MANRSGRTFCDFSNWTPRDFKKIDTSRVENGFAVARWSWARRELVHAERRAGQILVPVSVGANLCVELVIFQRYFVKVVPKPSIDVRAKDWLRSIYEPDVSALESLYGGDMSKMRLLE